MKRKPAKPPAGTDSGSDGTERLYAFVDRLVEGQEEEEAPETLEDWVLFEVAGRAFCLPVESVLEVVRMDRVTPVPGAPSAMRGVFNLRGRVVPLVDLASQLGLGKTTVESESRIVVLESRGRRLGALVDRTRELVGIPPSAIEPPPPELLSDRPRSLRGVFNGERGRWILLDPDGLFLEASSPPMP